MKKILRISAILFLTTHLFAQTNVPVKLALIAETQGASPDVDVLTATLSGGGKFQLLERAEIEKVYREQGMSAANRDDLKLGRILGADGVLLLDVVRTPLTTNLTARLIAVKPGVVLTDGSFHWPLEDSVQWAQSITTYLDTFLPKLTLLAKDAIPISIVNLRAAVSSAEEQETERDLKLLTIQRLSQERQLFVLERQKMQLLSEEKELKSDESAFWNGSYLLDGSIDQSGYSKETVTVSARLAPPKGGAPLLFEVSGSRTNLTEVVNRLAAKVIELLNAHSTVPQWSAANEAIQYFDEARWALRWAVYSEARAAADSAWALGKRDMGCAIVRIKAYESPLHFNIYKEGEFTNPRNTNEVVEAAVEEVAPNQPWGLTLREQNWGGTKVVQYVCAGELPDPESIEIATHALEFYFQFSQNSSEDLLKVASQESGWTNSAWYDLGIEDLNAASTVLQNFNFVPEAQKSMTDKLADLRSLVRRVAGWIFQSPFVHDSYFVGDRLATHDELANTIGEDGDRNPNIFSCEARWGCYWQEHPNDTIALYRELMRSPVFSYVHKNLWLRPLERPRLVTWNPEEKQYIPQAWNAFVQELSTSSNVLWQLEAKSFQLADANNDKQLAVSFTNLFEAVFGNQEALVNNNVELLYLDWGIGDLVSAKTGNGVASDVKESLEQLYNSKYRPQLEALDQQYWSKTVPAGQFQSTFDKQKQYLQENKPYDFFQFVNLFQSPNYSQSQALEIQPLIEAYKSNLVVQSQSASGMQKGRLMGAIGQVSFLDDEVRRILHPAASPPLRLQFKPPSPKPQPEGEVATAVSAAANVTETVTNVIPVNKFFAIPWESLVKLDNGERIDERFAGVTIRAHRWFEGRLFVDFEYAAGVEWLDEKGKIIGGGNVGGPAIGLFNPQTERWDVIGCPAVDYLAQNDFYYRSVLLNGDLFDCDGGQIRKYDPTSQQWQVLKVSDGNNYELFAINGRLYAANQNSIFEITDEGNSTHILASTRRQPPLTALDTQDLGTPTLLAGPNDSLRTIAAGKIWTWTGSNWHNDAAEPPAAFAPQLIPAGVLFYNNDSLSYLSTMANSPELYLQQKFHANNGGGFSPITIVTRSPESLWEMPPDWFLLHLPVAIFQSELYMLADIPQMRASSNQAGEQKKVDAGQAYNAELLCFSHGLPNPQKLFLNFDAPGGCPPSAGIDPSSGLGFPAPPPAWILSVTNFLLFGVEQPRNFFPTFNQPELAGNRYKAGVWLLSPSQTEPIINGQKQVQLAQVEEEKKQASATEEERRKALERQHEELLVKYDLNHNGKIDPEEREAALDDPIFIESELDVIDANHNGRLDPEELAYFDANHDKILEPKEQAGIDIAEHLFTERLMKKFDTNGDGALNRDEFNNLWQSCGFGHSISGFASFSVFSIADDNHDGQVDLKELETFLKQQLRQELRPRGATAAAFFREQMANPSATADPQQTFKAYVEFYWQHPDSYGHGGQTAKTQ